MEIDRPGIYQVRYEDLAPLIPIGPISSTIRLFRHSDEVAYIWHGDEDPLFEPGERLVFYAEPRSSRWSSIDVYRMIIGSEPGARILSRPPVSGSFPLGRIWIRATMEQNLVYTPDRLAPGVPAGRDGDRWAWGFHTGPASTAAAYPFSLSHILTDQPALLTLWLIGYTATAHRWEIQLNGAFIGEVTWSGRTAITATLPVPPHVLREGPNTLYLRPLNTEGGWLDAFEIQYARSVHPIGGTLIFEGESTPSRYQLPVVGNTGSYIVLDITNPLHPIRLDTRSTDEPQLTLSDPGQGGRRYVIAPADAFLRPLRIRKPEPLYLNSEAPSGADLVIIAHPDFEEALDPLRHLRHSQGLQVVVVNPLGIYDTYGDGRMDPEAIRRFIRDIYVRWDPRPTYVLLIGDGSFDPKRYRESSPPTYIPPYLAEVDPRGGETAADNRYVAVDGEDNLPDLIIGRIPVKSLDEAAAAVTKIVNYETRPLPGNWNARVILVADDADSAGNFPSVSEALANALPQPYTPVRLYCHGGSETQSDCPETEAISIRQQLLNEWNVGALILQFAGHASWHQWAIERLFHLDDRSALHNDRRLPIVLAMTCFTGSFHRPEPTVDEALLLHSNGGAVATWGSTGLGISRGHDRLSYGFFKSVFEERVFTIGEATMGGKLHLLASGQNLDLLDTFVLLGDPATRINYTIVPWAFHIYLPLVFR